MPKLPILVTSSTSKFDMFTANNTLSSLINVVLMIKLVKIVSEQVLRCRQQLNVLHLHLMPNLQ